MTQSKMTELVQKAKQYVTECNPTKAPYHSTRHMTQMCEHATLLYTRSSERDHQSGQDLPLLQLACLFHDYSHSGGYLPDVQNIAIATEAFRHWAKTEGVYQGDIERIVQMIEITEYPFKGDPLTFAEACIRDADVLYPALSEDPRIVMEALRREIEISKKQLVSYQDMYEGQRMFSDTVTLFTKLGRTLWDQATPPYIATLKDYVRYIEGNYDVNYNCSCYKEEQIKAEDIRALWWHQAVIEHTSREYREPHPLSIGLPSDAKLGPDLEGLAYLKRLQAYLGPERIAAYPKTVEILDKLYAEAESEFNAYPHGNATLTPRRLNHIHGSCVYRYRELKSRLKYLDRPRSWA